MPKYTTEGDIRCFKTKSCELKMRWDTHYSARMQQAMKEFWDKPENHDKRRHQLNDWWDKHPEERLNRAKPWGNFKLKVENGTRSMGEANIEIALQELSLSYEFEFTIGRYTVDFALPAYMVIIECDGNWHRMKPDREKLRDAYLLDRGWRVLHIIRDRAIGKKRLFKTEIQAFLSQSQSVTNL